MIKNHGKFDSLNFDKNHEFPDVVLVLGDSWDANVDSIRFD